VLRHEHFEELCAAASVGQATAEELAELEQHASECPSCRQAYFDYLSIAANEFVAAEKEPVLSPQEARECLDSELFTRRFLDRAEREGIVFSDQVAHEKNLHGPGSFFFAPRPWWKAHSSTMGAAVLLLLVLAGYVYRRNLSDGAGPEAAAKGVAASAPISQGISTERNISELTRERQSLQMEVDRLTGELGKTNEKLAATTKEQKSILQDHEKLASDRDLLKAQLSQAQRQLAKFESMTILAQHEAETQQKHASELEASLVAAQTELDDVGERLKNETASLERERELLAMGHDVSDLMGARNLHILDVVDTDPRGKTRPAFGRIFFTEGKSLIFYAYDLNEARIQKASYQYQVWAKKEGQSRPSQKLGIFYSDDKLQHRWVFKCTDPKILKEIDSVFVTLGRPNSDPSHPEGSRLMYAYLRGTPNHP
jgi:hypothetical protein